MANDCGVRISYLDAEAIEKSGIPEALTEVDALLVPGGFGKRGAEGKIGAIKYSRENGIPYLGICLGLQMAVVEFARNVLGLDKASSAEFDPKSSEPVIHLMDSQKKLSSMGATMRLGAYPCAIREGSKVSSIYKDPEISERHRHRWEVNNQYRDQFEKAGLQAVGLSPDGKLVEIIELRDHPWFIGTQFHP